MPDISQQITQTLVPSSVRTIGVSRVDEALPKLLESLVDITANRSVVTIEFDQLPDISAQIDCVLEELARLALSLWPNWYNGTISNSVVQSNDMQSLRAYVESAACPSTFRHELLMTWIVEASRRCKARKTPLIEGINAATQVKQLRLAISPSDLTIVLCLQDVSTSAAKLFGLARTAEWFARTMGASVLLLLPETLLDLPELDAVNFESIIWHIDEQARAASAIRETTHRIGPIVGRPHPLSKGEQLLAHRLSHDRMLRGLFTFNQWVKTRLDNNFLVDLLWAEGKVVVEVDGYEYHSNRFAFSTDRRRDYELVISGYLVLRVPHDEVIEDVEIVVEKIRDVVRFRLSNGTMKKDEIA